MEERMVENPTRWKGYAIFTRDLGRISSEMHLADRYTCFPTSCSNESWLERITRKNNNQIIEYQRKISPCQNEYSALHPPAWHVGLSYFRPMWFDRNWYQSRYRHNPRQWHGMGLRWRNKWWDNRGSNRFIKEWQLPWLVQGGSLLLSCLYMIMCWNGCHDNRTILGAFYMT